MCMPIRELERALKTLHDSLTSEEAKAALELVELEVTHKDDMVRHRGELLMHSFVVAPLGWIRRDIPLRIPMDESFYDRYFSAIGIGCMYDLRRERERASTEETWTVTVRHTNQAYEDEVWLCPDETGARARAQIHHEARMRNFMLPVGGIGCKPQPAVELVLT